MSEWALAYFRLQRRDKHGVRVVEHLRAIADVGEDVPELWPDEVELPAPLRTIFDVWLDLRQGVEAISYAEIEARARVTGDTLSSREVAILRAIEAASRAAKAEARSEQEQERRAGRGT